MIAFSFGLCGLSGIWEEKRKVNGTYSADCGLGLVAAPDARRLVRARLSLNCLIWRWDESMGMKFNEDQNGSNSNEVSNLSLNEPEDSSVCP